MSRPIVLVGAEFEENLSLRYLASAVAADGFDAVLVPFNEPAHAPAVIERLAQLDALVVGISVPFQVRAREFLDLATALRARGVCAPIVVGGHFATFEYVNLLRDFPAIDCVVRHEGELTLREICVAVRDGRPIGGIAGTVVRGSAGVVDAGTRRLPPLDELPFPDRSGEPHEVMGVRVSPLVASRGCYADCAFCCIYAYAENADGARYRRRSPENVALEMRREYDERGVRLFVFHDDNFFVPSARLNLARYQRLQQLLDGYGMRDIALVIKCRPNSVNLGQHLAPSAVRAGASDVAVTIRSDEWRWQVGSITDLTGATIVTTTLPAPGSSQPLTLTLRLATDTTTQAAFTVNGTVFGYGTESCPFQRRFNLTVSPTGVQITLVEPDDLPLAARQRAEIVLSSQNGRVLQLEARTPFRGNTEATWNVTAGALDAHTGSAVHWTLPPVPGIYQAELVIDYGADGLGYDVLLIEVV